MSGYTVINSSALFGRRGCIVKGGSDQTPRTESAIRWSGSRYLQEEDDEPLKRV
ncbi:MAG: hypothetical protein QXP27_09965 [Candidatus Methanomethyliaceae archaeon]